MLQVKDSCLFVLIIRLVRMLVRVGRFCGGTACGGTLCSTLVFSVFRRLRVGIFAFFEFCLHISRDALGKRLMFLNIVRMQIIRIDLRRIFSRVDFCHGTRNHIFFRVDRFVLPAESFVKKLADKFNNDGKERNADDHADHSEQIPHNDNGDHNAEGGHPDVVPEDLGSDDVPVKLLNNQDDDEKRNDLFRILEKNNERGRKRADKPNTGMRLVTPTINATSTGKGMRKIRRTT